MSKMVVMVFNRDPRDKGVQGFSDFIQGCVWMTQVCLEKGYSIENNYHGHPIDQILLSSDDTVVEEFYGLVPKHIHSVEEFDKGEFDKYVTTYEMPRLPISEETFEFVKTKFLNIHPSVEEEYRSRLEILNLRPKEYQIIHIRLGDEYLVDGREIDEYLLQRLNGIIHFLCPVDEKPTILISDTYKLAEKLSMQSSGGNSSPIHITQHSRSSSSESWCLYTLEELKDTFFDYYLLINTGHVYQFSNYEWGSGFSTWPCQIYGIPLTQYNLVKQAKFDFFDKK